MNARALASLGLVAALPLTATAALVTAVALGHVLRRAAAATRHLVWVGAFGALVVLLAARPLAPWWLWHVAVPSGDAGPAGPAVTSLASVWALGCIALLGYRSVGWLRAARLVRCAAPTDDPRIRRHLADACTRFGLDRPADVRLTSDSMGPAISGVVRTTVLLPVGALAWDDARLDVVLWHEVAHIARRDLLVEILAEVAVALYWYHPLAWLAARRERLAREQACDDAVLRGGAAAMDYASTLLALARTGRPTAPAAVLALSRPSALETRVVALLDASRHRGRASRRGRAGVLLALAVAGGVGRVHAVPGAPPHGPPGPPGPTSHCTWCRAEAWARRWRGG